MEPITMLMAGKMAGDVAGLGAQSYGAYKNYQLQKDNLEYQKKVQKKTWQREDSAVQRAAADMKKAGLSQTLAAGHGASSGPIVSTVAPRIDMPQIPDISAGIMALLKGQADVTQTNEQAKLAAAQSANVLKDTEIKSRDLELLRGTGVLYHGSPAGKLGTDVGGIVQKFKDALPEQPKSDLEIDWKAVARHRAKKGLVPVKIQSKR